jgi:hypothetical protein
MSTQRKTNASNPLATPKGQRALRRVALRRSLEQWKDDEPMTIAEAVALDVTAGALSEKGIRTAIENKSLPATKLNGKFWITIRGVQAAFAPTLVPALPEAVETANDNVQSEVKQPTMDERVLQLIESARVGRAKR